MLQAFWTELGLAQQQVKQKVTEAMRGGFTLHVTMVRENRAYLTSRRVDVPWSNKKLTVKWEHFVSKLEPAAKETWTAVITGPDAKKAVAEMVAALYDQSLDAYLPHHWQQAFGVFRQDHSRAAKAVREFAEATPAPAGTVADGAAVRAGDATAGIRRRFPRTSGTRISGMRNRGFAPWPARRCRPRPRRWQRPPRQWNADDAQRAKAVNAMRKAAHRRQRQAGRKRRRRRHRPPPPGPDLSKVSARKNLNETAFFFPQLLARDDGSVAMEFTMPEALTTWKFMGFAHDRDLRSGFIEDKVITSKDIMVQPNPPRFLREGDVLEFTVKVSNQSADASRPARCGSRSPMRARASPWTQQFGNTTDRSDASICRRGSRAASRGS